MQVDTHQQAGSELYAWRQFLGRATLWLGIVLLGSAVVCWVAANWPAMTKIQRFAGAQGLLALSAVIAAWVAWRLREATGVRRHGVGALLVLAGLFLGALLALLGQTYQTGADTWELFAWWALLLLPWALAGASQALWLLWALILNVAVALWLGERLLSWWWSLSGAGFPALVLAALNLAMLACWEWVAHHRHVSTRVGPRVLALLAQGVLVAALLFDFGALADLASATGIAWIATTLGMGFYYQQVRRDLVILALLAAAMICVSLRVVGAWLLELEPGVWAALPLAGLLMAEAVWAVRWLRRLGEQSTRAAVDAEPAGASAGNALDPAEAGAPVLELAPEDARGAAETPWYVHGLLGLSAWLATWLLLLFVAASGIVASKEGALVAGLGLCIVAVAVLRTDSGPFWRQCATAMGFAGQILVMVGLWDSASFASACFFILALGAVVYALTPDLLLRFLSGWMIALAGAGLIWRGLTPGMGDKQLLGLLLEFDALRAAFVWLPVAVVGAWGAAVAFSLGHRWSRIRPQQLDPLGWALALAVQSMVWLAGGVTAMQLRALWALHPSTAVLTVAGALLPVAVALSVLWPRRRQLTAGMLWGVPLALLVLALFWLPSPGVAFALAWLLLGFGLHKPRLTMLGVISLLAYLMIYYYQLQIPLLDKALWLAGGALLLFLGRLLVWLVPQWMRTAAPATRAPMGPPSRALRWRVALVLAGLAVTLAVVNGNIWQREALLAKGRVAILELAPVDPRSLMQGDYMALRFAAGEDIERWRNDRPADGQDAAAFAHIDGYVVLAPDERGVARPVRIQEQAAPRDGNEIVLRYRLRASGVRLVTNAYFFPEGEQQRYQRARYGEMRVDDRGTGLLVRMLGEDLNPL